MVDSSVWIDSFNGVRSTESRLLREAIENKQVLIGDLIVHEVLRGFRDDKQYEAAKTALLSFEPVPMLGVAQAVRAAETYRLLRKLGVTIRKPNDTLIASYCLTYDIPLLFTDRDFNPFVEHLGLRRALG